ncbi:hypothetical protein [Amycolatopsis vastitatis]|uniref:hypothetical protein n=1 Tax=Amycolatopsis vastitatis TaxID=1905142 RepID=UPI0011787C06|nr:hypothetical protein [Amycolatopsis vastitatis]
MSRWQIYTSLEILVLVALGYWAVVTWHGWPTLPAYLTAGLLVLHVLLPHQWGGRPKRNAVGKPEPEIIDFAELIRADDYVSKRYSIAAVDAFRRLVLDLPDHLSRVDQRLTLEGRQGTTNTFVIYRNVGSALSVKEQYAKVTNPPALGKESASLDVDDLAGMLVPLASVRRGYLFDGFEARSASGKLLATASQWEVRGLLFGLIKALFVSALRGDGLAMNGHEKYAFKGVIESTLCGGANDSDNDTKITAAFEYVANLSPNRFNEEKIARIETFCRSISRDYLIVVELEQENLANFKLSYKHVVTAAEVSKRREHRTRAKHGLAPVEVDVAMTWATLPDSFHFELTAPPGQYIFDHHLERLDVRKPLRQADFTVKNVKQYLRLHFERGHSIAHLYIRRVRLDRSTNTPSEPVDGAGDKEKADGSDDEIRDFKSVIRFKEIPPGVLGSAVTIAFFTSLIVCFYAFGRDVPLVQSVPGQAVLTLLMAAPAFLAAALGRGISSDKLPGASLTAFFGLWAVVLTSMASVILFLSDVTTIATLNREITFFGWPRHVSLPWVLLALFSVAVFLLLRKEKSDQRRYYLKISRRADIDRRKEK